MNIKKDYVVEIESPRTTWLAVASDEDELDDLPRTTDPNLAARFSVFNEARIACRNAAETFKPHAFRVGVLNRIARMESAETYSVDDAARHAKAWCETRPGWRRICDIEDTDFLYKTYSELPVRDRRYWDKNGGEYGWKEWGRRPCKVPFGFITGAGAFVRDILDVPLFHNSMMVFKVN